MHATRLEAAFFSQGLVLIALAWGIAGNSATAQTSHPTDAYGDRAEDDRGTHGDGDDFHEPSDYDPNEYDDFYYDPDYSPGYETSFFPRDYSVLGSDYSGYGVEFGPTRFGGDRSLGPNIGREDSGFSEDGFGFDNSSHPGSGIGNDYFTDDWYDDNSDFDNWY